MPLRKRLAHKAPSRMKAIAPITALAAFAFAACETTGDPNQGGLFGWSEGKARGRSAALEQALSTEDHRTAAARDSRPQLERTRARTASAARAERRKLDRMLTQLDDVEARGGETAPLRRRINAARNDESAADPELRAKVQSLDGEVRSMRSEYGLLQQRR